MNWPRAAKVETLAAAAKRASATAAAGFFWLTVAFAGAFPAGFASAAAADPEAPADLVLLNGRIHTQNGTRGTERAMAVRGNTIVALGSEKELRAYIGAGTRTIDLAGHVVLPGIIDAHTHPAQSAQDLGKCTLDDRPMPLPELKARVAECLRKNPGDPRLWFEVIQVDPSLLTLTRRDLDAILAAKPMLLEGADGHTVWANSAALRAAGIGPGTRNPDGGRIERDARGKPTGTLRDAAADLAMAAKPQPSLDVQADQLDRALGEMRAAGITSVQDAAVDENVMRIYDRLYATARLNMRVRGSFTIANLHEPAAAAVAKAVEFRAKWAVDPDFLRADAVKIFADGVIEYPSQTASLLEPYLDANGRPTGNRGPSYYEQDNLNRIVAGADAQGFTVHVHAIGDRAVRSSLDAFEFSRKLNGPSDNRDQIAHLELIDPADLPRFKLLGVIANFQLLWAMRDDYVVKATIAYIGPERSLHLYPARSVRDAGAVIAGGSDWGVSSFNAFEAMEHAVTRRSGRGEEPLLPEQSIKLQDAVDAYTINAAYALKQDRTTGSLEQGKRADFIVIDRDIFSVDAYELHSTQVLSTYLDGREVYSRPQNP